MFLAEYHRAIEPLLSGSNKLFRLMCILLALDISRYSNSRKTPIPRPHGRAMSVFRELFEEKWPRIIRSVLYVNSNRFHIHLTLSIIVADPVIILLRPCIKGRDQRLLSVGLLAGIIDYKCPLHLPLVGYRRTHPVAMFYNRQDVSFRKPLDYLFESLT